MSRKHAHVALIAALAAVLAVAPALAGSRAQRTRPSAGAKSAAPARAPGNASARAAGAPARASGRATYGYYHRGGRYGGHFGHAYYYGYPYYGPYAYWSWWGYPWWWGSHYYPYYRSYPVEVYPRADHVGPAGVETDVRPKKARVLLDGEQIGQARDYNGRWDVLRLKPGLHELEFSAPGYQTLKVALRARPGRLYRVDYRLQPGEGLDPRSVSPEDLRAEPLESEARPRVTPEPRISADDRPAQVSRLKSGFLRFSVSPADAAVYLDGEFLARADELARLHGAVPVAAGPHRIEVVRPGYTARAVAVDVAAGETSKLDLDLSPE